MTDRNTDVTALTIVYERHESWTPMTTTTWLRRVIHV
jgi:hypothetical protein